MKTLVVKLQYKNYERGEFTREQHRILEETLELIKQYPWDEQRHLTDIEPTGPSVTIKSDQGEYLKVGLYFNQKYCLYLLNTHNTLFEFHTASMQDVCDVVTKFFNGADLKPLFEKHLLSIGEASHFLSKSLKYCFDDDSFWIKYAFLCIGSIFVLGTAIFSVSRKPLFSLVLALFLFILFKQHQLYLNHYKYLKGACLKLGRGHEKFSFGYNNEFEIYQKSDIAYINIKSGANSPKKGQSIEVYHINFKNGSYIRLSSLLIPSWTFEGKFPNTEIRYETAWWPMLG